MSIAFPPPEACVLVVIDIQERLCQAMPALEQYLPNMTKAVSIAAAIGVPTIVTEQYPKGLGKTLPAVHGVLPPAAVAFEKVSFSCWGSDEFASAITASGADCLVLIGMETHVCVQQTAVEANRRGYEVVLLQDAVCSRKSEDRETALRLLEGREIVLTTVESLAFDWLTTAKHPAFKAVSAIVKD